MVAVYLPRHSGSCSAVGRACVFSGFALLLDKVMGSCAGLTGSFRPGQGPGQRI